MDIADEQPVHLPRFEERLWVGLAERFDEPPAA